TFALYLSIKDNLLYRRSEDCQNCLFEWQRSALWMGCVSSRVSLNDVAKRRLTKNTAGRKISEWAGKGNGGASAN
ncbi:hypothetical protein, partial [Ensifer aridi]|uniref:hypothetical protein n=1 Tax=Ensifer aridi TaxID=1708715 RepID=UPI001AECD3E2